MGKFLWLTTAAITSIYAVTGLIYAGFAAADKAESQNVKNETITRVEKDHFDDGLGKIITPNLPQAPLTNLPNQNKYFDFLITGASTDFASENADYTVTLSFKNKTNSSVELKNIAGGISDWVPMSTEAALKWVTQERDYPVKKTVTANSQTVAPGQNGTFTLTFKAEQLKIYRTASQLANWGPRGLEVNAKINLNGKVQAINARSFVTILPPQNDAKTLEITPSTLSVIVPPAENYREISPEKAKINLAASPEKPAEEKAATNTSNKEIYSDEPAHNSKFLIPLIDPGKPHKTGIPQLQLPWADPDWRIFGTNRYLQQNPYFNGQIAKAVKLHPTTPVAELLEGNLENAGLNWLSSQGVTTVITVPGQLGNAGELTYTPTAFTKAAFAWPQLCGLPKNAYTINQEKLTACLQNNPTANLNILNPDENFSWILQGIALINNEKYALDAWNIRQLVFAQSAIYTRQRPQDSRWLLGSLSRYQMLNDQAAKALQTLERASWIKPTTIASELAKLPYQKPQVGLPRAIPGAIEDTQSAARAKANTVISAPNSGVFPGQSVLNGTDGQTVLGAAKQLAATLKATVKPGDHFKALETYLENTLSVAARYFPATRRDYAEAFLAGAKTVNTALSVAPSSQINLLTTHANFPVHLENNLPVDVKVQVRLISDNPILNAKEQPLATIPANSSLSLQIPITAVSSGNIKLTAQLFNENGEKIGTTQTISVRVRAGWETKGLGAIAGALLVLLLLGFWRSYKKGRRFPLPKGRDKNINCKNS